MTVLQPTVEFDLPCCQHLYLIKQWVENISQIPMNKNKSTANCANAHLLKSGLPYITNCKDYGRLQIQFCIGLRILFSNNRGKNPNTIGS